MGTSPQSVTILPQLLRRACRGRHRLPVLPSRSRSRSRSRNRRSKTWSNSKKLHVVPVQNEGENNLSAKPRDTASGLCWSNIVFTCLPTPPLIDDATTLMWLLPQRFPSTTSHHTTHPAQEPCHAALPVASRARVPSGGTRNPSGLASGITSSNEVLVCVARVEVVVFSGEMCGPPNLSFAAVCTYS
jgi:hypothetical protein